MAAGLDPVAGLAAGVGSERPKPARCGPAAIRLDHTVTVGSAIRDIERRLVAAPVRSASIKAAYCPTVESSGSPSRAQFVFEIRQGGPRAARKPGSVPLRAVTICLRRRLPGASSDRYPSAEASSLKRPPIWSCSGRGLPGRPVTRPPVGSYPTFSPLPSGASPEINAAWRLFSVALCFGSPRLGVTQRPALWSPGFPPTVFTYVGGRPSASAQANSTQTPWVS